MTDIYETLTDDQKEILDKVDPNSVLLQLEGVREILSTFQDRIDITAMISATHTACASIFWKQTPKNLKLCLKSWGMHSRFWKKTIILAKQL